MKYPILLTIFLLISVAFSPQQDDDKEQFLLNHLEESEKYILHMLKDVTSAHWTSKPDSSTWSIAECSEHILTAEKAILQNIRKTIESETPLAKEVPSTDEDILNAIFDRVSNRVKTLPSFEPEGVWSSKQNFIEAYKEARKELYEFLQANEKNLHHYYTQSPAGEVSLHQMLLVLSAHTARHTHQIEEVKHGLDLATSQVVFGGNVKVNVHTSKREEVQRLFGDILLLDIDQQERYDRVLFDGDGFVAFVYHEDKGQLLAKEDFVKSMQAGLQVPASSFESIKRRIIASGAEAYTPPYDVNPEKYFYFHAPGGQIFRLVKKSNR